MPATFFALPGNEALAGSLAAAHGAEPARYEMRQFPDGEFYIRIEEPPDDKPVYLVCTLDRPTDKILPLMLLGATARDLGARAVGLICPYLPYMRQDKRFHIGEGVTSRYFAAMLGRSFDSLLTIDPHLHRYKALSEVYDIPATALHAAPLLAGWIRDNVRNPVLVGPDSESAQWVAAVAKLAGTPWIVLEKTRRGDRDVSVSVPDVEKWASRTPVLVDDIISTARTMIETVGHLQDAGLAPPVCVGVHALFAGSAYDDLQRTGVARVATCNTVIHPSNAIDVTGLLVDALKRHEGAKAAS